jgi:hypothetical protein
MEKGAENRKKHMSSELVPLSDEATVNDSNHVIISYRERLSTSLNTTGFLPTLDNPNINSFVGLTRVTPVFMSP